MHCRLPQPEVMSLLSQGSRHPRDLHSFPTRRSSDLPRPDIASHDRMALRAVPALLVVMAFGYSLSMNGGSITDANRDRKSTRLNSSHVEISYAVFCLKKKTMTI